MNFADKKLTSKISLTKFKKCIKFINFMVKRRSRPLFQYQH